MRSIGIIGTAKNTGKTTTLSAILKSLNNKKVAVTGIGYDGEEIDNITLLPKPRLYFDKSVIVATAEKCIVNSEAGYRLIQKTDIETSLGFVCIAEVTKPGLIVIAGPNRASQLKELITIINELGRDYLLVDGSLNRISPMYLLDDLIFTTGGSRTTDISVLVDEMVTVEKIFTYPDSGFHADNPSRGRISNPSGGRISNISAISFVSESGIVNAGLKTFIDQEDVKFLIGNIPGDCRQIVIPVFFSEAAIRGLMDYLNSNKKETGLILLSPVQLLLSADFARLRDFIASLSGSSVRFSYMFKPVLKAITINPFFPKLYNNIFVADYMDKELFLKEMCDKLKTPVFNVEERLVSVS